MKTSAESMSWYKKVNETWKSVGVNPDVWKSTPADYKIACKTIKALWKKEMGTKFPYELKQVTGNRDTWCRDRCTFTVNPEKGWAEIIHSLGHWMGYMKNLKRPHCAELQLWNTDWLNMLQKRIWWSFPIKSLPNLKLSQGSIKLHKGMLGCLKEKRSGQRHSNKQNVIWLKLRKK